MERQTAETVADLLLGAALLGAAVVILRTPALRRLAAGLIVTTLTVTVPGWLKTEVQRTWAETATPRG